MKSKIEVLEDIMIVSVDGLTGFVDAIHAVFPLAEIQRCIVHQIRYSTKFYFLQRYQSLHERPETGL